MQGKERISKITILLARSKQSNIYKILYKINVDMEEQEKNILRHTSTQKIY